MTPSPEDDSAAISCDMSSASASSFDDIEFDPDAVDFEPLMVSGTGKILSYHRSSYHEYEGSVSGNSSLAPPSNVNTGNRERQMPPLDHLLNRASSCSSSRFVLLLSSIALLAVLAMGGLSLFAMDANNSYTHHRLQTVVTKENAMANQLDENMEHQSDAIIQQHMTSADVAAIEGSSLPVAFWDAFLGHPMAPTNQLLSGNFMNVMSHCFGRPIFQLQIDGSGSHNLQQMSEGLDSPQMTARPDEQASPTTDVPMAVFTPDFKQTAMKMFGPSNQGAFMTILHDPIDVYSEQYKEQQEALGNIDASKNIDNLMVRHLSGIGNEIHKVNVEVYEVARQILMSKFVLGSCDHPTETIRRLVSMFGNNDALVNSDRCTEARQGWNLLCRKMTHIGNQFKGNQDNMQILESLKSDHHFDMMLYEESKKMFIEQRQLFE